jgi:hypothetical protein
VYIVSLIDTKGASIRVHSAGQTGAETFKRELEELLAGQRQRIEVVTPPIYWMLAFAALLVLFAVYEIRAAIRSWGKYARPARTRAAGRPIVLWGALTVGALVVARDRQLLPRAVDGRQHRRPAARVPPPLRIQQQHLPARRRHGGPKRWANTPAIAKNTACCWRANRGPRRR